MHQPRYLDSSGPSFRELVAERIGYAIWDAASESRLVVLPGVSTLTPALSTPTVNLREEIDGCDLLLLDGTFWSEDELRGKTPHARTATEMGHLRVGGLQGSLDLIKPLNIGRKIYVHVNNTNPMLNEDSPEHKAVRAAGAEVGYDGLEIEL
jgi:pyrroloquinoline quinone biosynthesis protein B